MTKPLTELCLTELALAGATSSEIAAVIGEDSLKVRAALSDLFEAGKVDRRRLALEGRVYFYFLKKEERSMKPTKPKVETQAGPAYFRQFRWGCA
tara:strand:- start:343 stop:627 length:285 start_codon:yes stop_codon:yes gene_type:complete